MGNAEYMGDAIPFPVNIGWTGTAEDKSAAVEVEGRTPAPAAEGETNSAPVFPSGTCMNMLKILTFYRKRPFEMIADYADASQLLPKTPKDLGKFRIELPETPEAKRIKVKARLSQHGTFNI